MTLLADRHGRRPARRAGGPALAGRGRRGGGVAVIGAGAVAGYQALNGGQG